MVYRSQTHPMYSDSRPFLFILIFVIAGIFVGCESLRNDGEVRGRVEVRLTDAPLDEFDEVLVTIERVELLGRGADGESTLLVLSDEPQVFNLLELQHDVSAPLADVDIPAGRYNQLRLVIDEEADVQMKNGPRVRIPSGDKTGLRVVFPSFSISADRDVAQVTVDFDVNDSFVNAGSSGTYIFKPVVRAHALVVNGEDVEIDAEDTSI